VVLLTLFERVPVERRLAVDDPLQQLLVLLRDAPQVALPRSQIERELGGAWRLGAGEAFAALLAPGRVDLE
jgi:hypothetical protein